MTMKQVKIFFVGYASIVAIFVVGWGLNIAALINTGLDHALTTETVLRLVGIPFVPLGVIMGYFF
jgi:hypothetical protein